MAVEKKSAANSGGMTFRIRVAAAEDTSSVSAAYHGWNYRRPIASSDTVWLAENATGIVGLVRIAREHETLVLRGMRIAEPCRRQGLGSRMLGELANWLGDRECYCIPYAHLTGFYGQAGFVEIAPDVAPRFLRDRLAEYRTQPGLEFTLMRR